MAKVVITIEDEVGTENGLHVGIESDPGFCNGVGEISSAAQHCGLDFMAFLTSHSKINRMVSINSRGETRTLIDENNDPNKDDNRECPRQEPKITYPKPKIIKGLNS